MQLKYISQRLFKSDDERSALSSATNIHIICYMSKFPKIIIHFMFMVIVHVKKHHYSIISAQEKQPEDFFYSILATLMYF
jgi:hypothetical protein